MHEHSHLIARWPTAAQFARDLGVPYQTVVSWRHRGIPPQAWAAVVSLMRAEGHADVSVVSLREGYIAHRQQKLAQRVVEKSRQLSSEASA